MDFMYGLVNISDLEYARKLNLSKFVHLGSIHHIYEYGHA